MKNNSQIWLTGLLAAVFATLMAAAPVQAQISSKGGPIMIGGDSWSADQNTHLQIWDGRVEIVQNDSRLRADHIKVTHAPGKGGDGKGFGDVMLIEATGNVYYITPEETVKGDKAVYTQSDDTLVISGEVIIQQGQNVMTGSRLASEIKAGRTTMDAQPTSLAKGRVKGVFYPDE